MRHLLLPLLASLAVSPASASGILEILREGGTPSFDSPAPGRAEAIPCGADDDDEEERRREAREERERERREREEREEEEEREREQDARDLARRLDAEGGQDGRSRTVHGDTLLEYDSDGRLARRCEAQGNGRALCFTYQH